MPTTRRLLAIALGAALALPASLPAQTASLVPALEDMPASAQRMAPVVARFRTDLAALERVYDITAGVGREAALRRLYTGWQARLAEVDVATLALEDQVDHALL